MANWNQPALTDTYANFLAFLDARLDDLAYGLDPAITTVTNPPANSIRWSSASNRWEKFVSGSWAVLSANYAINISGNAATATALATARTINGVSFNGSANITITATTTQALTFSTGGAGAVNGTTFDGGTARTISYNSVGAPGADGTNATGTWAISISGNAATATSATTAASASTATSATTATTATTANGLATGNSYQVGSLGVGVAASGTSGEIRASNNITAYYSSDRRLKENIRDIQNAVDAVHAIGGKLFDWTDAYVESRGGADGYFVRKSDFGVVAQDVQSVFPLAVREREDGTLAVDYEKLCALAFAAIKELSERVKELEAK